jgi:hypothetical protein
MSSTFKARDAAGYEQVMGRWNRLGATLCRARRRGRANGYWRLGAARAA